MTIKNFKVGQGLDLDGLVLTNGNGELLVNGNAIAVDLTGYATENYVANALTSYATQAYVTNAISNSTPNLVGYATENYVANALTAYTTTAALANSIVDNDTIINNAAGTYLKVNTNVIATRAYVGNTLVDYVTLDGTQTLSNKTLTSPTITIPSTLPGQLITTITGGDTYGISSNSFVVSNVPYSTLQSVGFITVSGNSSGDGTYAVSSIQDGMYAGFPGIILAPTVSLQFDQSASIQLLQASDPVTISSTELGYLDGVNGTIATEAYVINAIANSSVDLANSAGTFLDYNNITNQLDVSANALAGNGLMGATDNSGIDVDFYTVATTLVNSYNIAQANVVTYATQNYVGNAIANLVDGAPAMLDTLNELAAALQDNPNVISTLQGIASGKQNLLTEGLGIDIVGNTISTNMSDIANAIAGTGITYDSMTGTLTAAPGYISSVDASFAVSGSGQLSLSDNITIASVELTDSVANVTAASDVFGDASLSAYTGGSAVTVGTLPAGTDVADVFITLKTAAGASVYSRTSKLTFVNTGGDAPTWTEYGIIASGSFPATTISFNSSGDILVDVASSDSYSVKGVVTVLK